MFPHLTSSSNSDPEPVHISLQPMTSPPPPFVKAVLEEPCDPPTWEERHVIRRRSSVASSNSGSASHDSSRSTFSWRDVLCIPLLPFSLLSSSSHSQSSSQLQRASNPVHAQIHVQSTSTTSLDPSPLPHTPIVVPPTPSTGSTPGVHHVAIDSERSTVASGRRSGELSPFMMSNTTGNQSRLRPPSWNAAVPIMLDLD